MNNVRIVIVSLVLAVLASFAGGFLATKILLSKISFDEEGGVALTEHVYIEESEMIDTIAKVTPAVVSIVVSKDVPIPSFSDPYHDRRSEPVFEEMEIAGGTGFIVSKDGLILTNKHVLEGSSAETKYKVRLSDDTEYVAEVISKDPFDDVAALKVVFANDGEKKDLPFMVFGDSDNLQVGQKVLAIGNALAMYGNTVTSGIVSAMGREVVAYNDVGAMSENLSGLIQTDAAINFGNSGGPLVNIAGEVIGMNVAVAEYANNIGFAIPSNDLKPILKSIEKYGEIVRPVLGVRFVMLSEKQAKELDVDIDHGAILVSGGVGSEPAVIDGGSADLAGLRELDVILAINGVTVNKDNPLHRLIKQYNPGDKVKMKVWRDGEEMEVEVSLQSSKDL